MKNVPQSELLQLINDASAELMRRATVHAVAMDTPEPVNPVETVADLRKQVQQIDRDRIIRSAKQDVKELEYRGTSLDYVGGDVGNNTYRFKFYRVEYITNHESGVVVALVKNPEGGKAIERGVAKCESSDCFNVHIGKAIALRRAFGLTIPAEYLEAPQPTEIRIGDVVNVNDDRMFVTEDTTSIADKKIRLAFVKSLFPTRIIDDSRLEVE